VTLANPPTRHDRHPAVELRCSPKIFRPGTREDLFVRIFAAVDLRAPRVNGIPAHDRHLNRCLYHCFHIRVPFVIEHERRGLSFLSFQFHNCLLTFFHGHVPVPSKYVALIGVVYC
jgi:hypothetical protein